jgi:hypothetical protein
MTLATDGTALYAETDYGDALYRWNGASWDACTVPTAYSEAPLVDGDTLYVADFSESVFTSTDGGLTWTTVNVGAGVDTFLPSAYREGDLLGVNQFSGMLRRSTDGGATWTDLGPPPEGSEGFVEHDGVLYARVYEDGVWASTDDGATWTDTSTGLPDGWGRWTMDLAVTASGDLLASTLRAGTYRYDGTAWSESQAGMTGGTPVGAAMQGGRLLVTFTTDNVWSYDPATAAWTALPSPHSGQAQLGRLAANEDTIVVSSAYEGLYRSTDGGSTWSSANSGLPRYIGDAGSQPLDATALAILGDSVFDAHPQDYEGSHEGTMTPTGGGVSVSTNAGRSWEWQTDGLPVVGSDNTGDPLFPSMTAVGAWTHLALVGSVGNGVFWSDDGGTTWSGSRGLGGTTMVTALASVGGAYFAGTEDQNYWTSDTGNGLWRSDDDGATWSRAETGLPSHPQVTALASAGHTLFALVTSPSEGIWRLDADTAAWSLVAEPPAGVTLQAPMVVTDDGFFVGSATSGMLELRPE